MLPHRHYCKSCTYAAPLDKNDDDDMRFPVQLIKTKIAAHLRSIPALNAHPTFPISHHKNYISTISQAHVNNDNNMNMMNTKKSLSFNRIEHIRKNHSPTNAKKFIPRKAAVELTQNARSLFKKLLKNRSQEGGGIILKLQHSTSGQPRMVFTFGFVEQKDIEEHDEGVSLELLEDEKSPKLPVDSMNDGLPKLIIHGSSFIKVLGGTLNVEITDDGEFIPKIHDREGNLIDPNV